MERKGFTLVEVLLGLFLLGLISVIALPILTSSLGNISRSKIKLEMNYIGEMSIERIKSYDEKKSAEIYIFDKEVSEIVNLFRIQDRAEIELQKEEDGEKYLLKIVKQNRASKLWMIKVYVYHDKEGSKLKHVEYQTYLLQK